MFKNLNKCEQKGLGFMNFEKLSHFLAILLPPGGPIAEVPVK